MIDPRAYTIQLPDYANTAFSGLAQGMQIGAYQNQLEAQKLKAEQDAIQKQQMQNDIAAYVNNTNKTAEDTTNLMVKYPSISDNLSKAFSVMDTSKKDNLFRTSAQVLSAINGGRVDVAKQILEEQKAGHLNAGRPDDAGRVDALIKQINVSPESVASNAELTMASIDPTKFAETYKALRGEGRADQMQPYEIAGKRAQTMLTGAQTQKALAEGQQAVYEAQNTPVRLQLENQLGRANVDKVYADIDNQSARLGLDRDKLTSDVELKLTEMAQSGAKLSDGAQKIVNDAVVASSAASVSSNSLNDLANRLDSAGGGFGTASRFSEWFKGATGNQDAMTSLRQEYVRMRNSEGMKMLPPGPATDRDIELVMKGFPKETADSREIASFLRGMAKLNQRTAVMEEAKAEWANMNGNMGSNKRDIEVLGVRIPKGTTFNNFVSKNFDTIQKEQGNQRVRQQVASGQRSYMQGQ